MDSRLSWPPALWTFPSSCLASAAKACLGREVGNWVAFACSQLLLYNPGLGSRFAHQGPIPQSVRRLGKVDRRNLVRVAVGIVQHLTQRRQLCLTVFGGRPTIGRRPPPDFRQGAVQPKPKEAISGHKSPLLVQSASAFSSPPKVFHAACFGQNGHHGGRPHPRRNAGDRTGPTEACMPDEGRIADSRDSEGSRYLRFDRSVLNLPPISRHGSIGLRCFLGHRPLNR